MRFSIILLFFILSCTPTNPSGGEKPPKQEIKQPHKQEDKTKEDKKSEKDKKPKKVGDLAEGPKSEEEEPKSEEGSKSGKKPDSEKGKKTVEASMLLKAAKANDLSKVNEALAQNADVNAKDETGYTPLLWAVLNGNKDIVEALIKKKANVNEKTKEDETALMLATFLANQDLINVLLAAGADVNAKTNAERPINALIIAGATGSNSIINKLIDSGADKDANYTKDLQFACDMANAVGNLNAEKLLITKGLTRCLLNFEPAALKGANTLHLSSFFFDDPNLIGSLLSKGQKISAKIEDSGHLSQNFKDETPLSLALSGNHLASAQALIDAGEKIDQLIKDRSLISITVSQYGPQAVELLVKNGADLTKEDNKPFGLKSGGNLLHILAESGKDYEPEEKAAMARILIDKKVKIDLENKDHMTPLDILVKDGCNVENRNAAFAKVLLDNGASVNGKSDFLGRANHPFSDCTILGKCIANERWDFVKQILKSANVDKNSKQCKDDSAAGINITPLQVLETLKKVAPKDPERDAVEALLK